MSITLPSFVAPNELIQSAWGNSVVDALDELETYVDTEVAAGDATRVAKTGDVMSGGLQIISDASTNVGAYLSTGGGIRSYITNPNGVSDPNFTGIRAATPGGTGGIFALWQRLAGTSGAGTTIGSITAVAGGSTVAYNTSSDYRLKNDLGPVHDALERVRRLRPIRATWKNDSEAQEFDTFLADELQDVVGYAVTGKKDAVHGNGDIDPQQVDRSALVPLLVAAVIELCDRVAELESA